MQKRVERRKRKVKEYKRKVKENKSKQVQSTPCTITSFVQVLVHLVILHSTRRETEKYRETDTACQVIA